MPRSKRAKVVHLSKVEKKGKELTIKIFDAIRESVEKYPYCFVFSVDNMRNTYLKDVRTQLSDSRLFFGKTKVMAKALGADAATEPAPNTHLLNPYLAGDVGLLFTARSPEDVLSYFSTFHPQDFARAGFRAPRDFSLQPGILYSNPETLMPEEDVPLAHTQDPILRKLNVPTRVVKGKVVLGEEGGEPHVVCKEGEILGSGQTTLLKMFGIQMAEFAVEVKAWWSKETSEVTVREASEMTVDA